MHHRGTGLGSVHLAQDNVASRGPQTLMETPSAPSVPSLPEAEPPNLLEARVIAKWQRLVYGARHLSFVRRVWGLLGGHLRAIRERGRQA